MKRTSFLYFCAFLYSLATSVLGFTLIYLLTDRFGFSAGQVGASIAASSLTYFIGCNVYQRFFTGIRPQTIIPTAVTIALAGAAAAGLARIPVLVAAGYCLQQLGSAFFWPPLMGWLTQSLESGRLSKGISRFNVSWLIGSLIAPLAGGFLYRRSVVLIFIVVFAGLALTLYLLRRLASREKVNAGLPLSEEEAASAAAETSFASGSDVQAAAANMNGEQKAPFQAELAAKERGLAFYKLRAWLGAMCSNFVGGVIGNILPLYVRDGMGYTETTAGSLLLIRGLAQFIGFTMLARLNFWQYNRRWFFIVQGTFAASLLTFIAAGKTLPVLVLAIFVVGLANAAGYNNSIFYSGADTKNARKNMAYHEIFLSVGNMSGTLGGGISYQRFGMTGTFLATALILSIFFGVYKLIDKKAGPPPQKTRWSDIHR